MAGQSDPFPLTGRMEAFQRGCVNAVAAAAGILTTPVGEDFDKTDALLTFLDEDGGALDVKAQLKSTSSLTEREGHVHFELDVETFEKLRNAKKTTVPRALVLMELPTNPDEWTTCDHATLSLRRRVFWADLYHEPSTSNASSKTVAIPLSNLLTAGNLRTAIKNTHAAFNKARGAGDGN